MACHELSCRRKPFTAGDVFQCAFGVCHKHLANGFEAELHTHQQKEE